MPEIEARKATGRDLEAVDDELISRIAAGDAGSFEKLYRSTDKAVYACALSILKNHHDAEDVMQETYLRVRGAAAGFRPDGKAAAWVLTIARNLAYMRLRSLKLQAPQDPELLEGRADPEEPAHEFDNRAVLQSALKILDDTERQVVLLHSVSGMKHREIAELLKIPLSTVLSKYSRSLTKLKKYLQREWDV